MPRSMSCNHSRIETNHDKRDNAMATFLNGMDARAVLWMFSQIQDRPLETLKGKSMEQMRISMMFQAEINVNEWTQKTTEFLNTTAKDICEHINWNGYNVFGMGGGAPETSARGTAESASAQVLEQLATPAGLAPDVTQQILFALEKISDKLNSTQLPNWNQHSAAQRLSASCFNELLEQAGGVDGDSLEQTDEPPAKKAKTVLEVVWGYWNGTIPLLDRQRVVHLELQKIDHKTLHGFFGALCWIAATIDTPKDEHCWFIESTAHTEAMVYEFFNEAVAQQKFLTAEQHDMLEIKCTTLIKAKLLSAKDFNFVKAVADAEQQIFKDLKDIAHRAAADRHRAVAAVTTSPSALNTGSTATSRSTARPARKSEASTKRPDLRRAVASDWRKLRSRRACGVGRWRPTST